MDIEGTAPQDHNNEESDENDENSNIDDTCPLFMEGLPRDFGSNRHLMALASLLASHTEEQEKNTRSDARAEKGTMIIDGVERKPFGDEGKTVDASSSSDQHTQILARSETPPFGGMFNPKADPMNQKSSCWLGGRKLRTARKATRGYRPNKHVGKKLVQRSTACATSVAEAQLFLGLWKL